MKMHLFSELNIETCSDCNRTCPTCERNSYPYPAALAGREAHHEMPSDLVRSLIDQAADLGHTGTVCIQHYNEPLLDPRIGEFGAYAKAKGCFSEVYLNTNGDLITPERAALLDGSFDRFNIALYGPGKDERKARLLAMFQRTSLTFTDGSHVVTHYSPFTNREHEIENCRMEPCEREAQMRLILAWDGSMLMCCDDIAGECGLGNAHDTALRDLWFSPRHVAILTALGRRGGRYAFPLCYNCPRGNNPFWSTWNDGGGA